MINGSRAAGAVAIVLAVGLAACSGQQQGQQQGQGAVRVGVVAVKRQSVTLSSELPGRTTAFQAADVRPQVTGIIQKRLFAEGSEVRAGQSLYQIDPATYEATFQSAQAALDQARADVESAQLKASRYQKLIQNEAISQQDLEDATMALKVARASEASAEAALRQARIDLDYTQVKAPISGRIGRALATAGALVTADQADAIASIQQLDPIYVDLSESSGAMLQLKRDLAAGRLQQAGDGKAVVRLELEDGSEYEQPGALTVSEVTVDPSTGTVTLRAEFPNPDRLLMPGMYVRARLQVAVDSNALLVPQRAVTRTPKGDATTLVVGKDNKVEVRTLQVRQTLGDAWVVTGGIEDGERVIVDGLQKVRPGAEVAPVPADGQST